MKKSKTGKNTYYNS